MKHKVFFDLHHASGYLKDSIIRVDGDPIYIQDVAARRRKKPNNYDLIYTNLGNKNDGPHTISIQDNAVDMNPIPLGLCNFVRNGSNFATSVMRAPMRMWKVGLTTRNAVLKAPHREYDGMIGANQLLFSNAFAKMVRGEYPSLKEIAKKLNDRNPGGAAAYIMAFSRNFAVDNKKLYYRSFGEVGFHKNGEVRLDDEHTYLQELLDKDMKR